MNEMDLDEKGGLVAGLSILAILRAIAAKNDPAHKAVFACVDGVWTFHQARRATQIVLKNGETWSRVGLYGGNHKAQLKSLVVDGEKFAAWVVVLPEMIYTFPFALETWEDAKILYDLGFKAGVQKRQFAVSYGWRGPKAADAAAAVMEKWVALFQRRSIGVGTLADLRCVRFKAAPGADLMGGLRDEFASLSAKMDGLRDEFASLSAKIDLASIV